MSIADEPNIAQLSELCHINLTEEEAKTTENNLKKIIKYMTLLEEVNTEGVLPCAHVLETVVNVMFEDEPGPCLDREEILKNAPDQVAGMIKVPSIIEREE